MQGQPHGPVQILRHFDEVIPAAKRAERELPIPVVLIRRRFRILREPLERLNPIRRAGGQPGIIPARAHRDALFDAAPNAANIRNIDTLQG